MRLLHVRSFDFKEFFDDKIPYYAILSHTWEEEEVSFQAMQGCQNPDSPVREMKGFKKIKGCCDKAIEDGFDYVWIDTCCIDKTSSAELSEAINSMWKWYKAALVCYVYLSDVEELGDTEDQSSPFRRSRWFTRGWTLQELIAPYNVIFYNTIWHELGTKLSLRTMINSITKIPEEVLKGREVRSTSVAQRMSWASDRQTSRIEDIAYCLMGLFGVNMSLLYGEGQRAFIRLQEEIIKKNYEDHTIFAWHQKPSDMNEGILGTSPAAFGRCQNIVEHAFREENLRQRYYKPRPFSLDSRGIQIELPIIYDRNRKDCTAALYCRDTLSDDTFLGIRLQRIGDEATSEFGRMNDTEPFLVSSEHVRMMTVTKLCILRADHVLQNFDDVSLLPFMQSRIRLSTQLLDMGVAMSMAYPEGCVQSNGYILFNGFLVVGIELTSPHLGDVFIILKRCLDHDISVAVTRANSVEDLKLVTNQYRFTETELSDRAVWPFGNGQLLTVATKVQVVNGEREQVVLVDITESLGN